MLKRRLRTFSTYVLVGIIVIALRILGWSQLLIGTLILATFISWMIEEIPSNVKRQITQRLYKVIFPIHGQVAGSSNMPKRWLRAFSTPVLVGIIAIALRILGWSRPMILTVIMVWTIGKISSNTKKQIVQPSHKETPPQSQQETSTSSNSGPALRSRIQIYSRSFRTISPSSQIGPEVAVFPVTGYSIAIEMICLGQTDLTILGFKAEVIRLLV